MYVSIPLTLGAPPPTNTSTGNEAEEILSNAYFFFCEKAVLPDNLRETNLCKSSFLCLVVVPSELYLELLFSKTAEKCLLFFPPLSMLSNPGCSISQASFI